tara:strand:- start:996 stop:1154 length:159 start_codon:yes stop_codon:yes gene_type:complete
MYAVCAIFLQVENKSKVRFIVAIFEEVAELSENKNPRSDVSERGFNINRSCN